MSSPSAGFCEQDAIVLESPPTVSGVNVLTFVTYQWIVISDCGGLLWFIQDATFWRVFRQNTDRLPGHGTDFEAQ
jgi:hypothetical protein